MSDWRLFPLAYLTGERRSPQAAEGLSLEFNSRACTPRSFYKGLWAGRDSPASALRATPRGGVTVTDLTELPVSDERFFLSY